MPVEQPLDVRVVEFRLAVLGGRRADERLSNAPDYEALTKSLLFGLDGIRPTGK